jgi:hypothetical protein
MRTRLARVDPTLMPDHGVGRVSRDDRAKWLALGARRADWIG